MRCTRNHPGKPSLARVAGLILLAGLALSCQSTARRAALGRALASPARGHRVILISLDGAAAADLFRLHRAGQLHAGFERFFAEGEVAEAMLPVSPASTATNHASLATGFPPSRTGIVSNSFHLAGRPLEERAGGLYTPIGVETLWQAARRQGKRVGVVVFPGFEAGPRGNWGFDWPLRPLLRSRLIELPPSVWNPVSQHPVSENAPSTRSFAPPLQASLGGGTGCAATARDGSDDGEVDYDSIGVLCTDSSGHSLPALDFRVGDWRRVHLAPPGSPGAGAFAWAKLLALDPKTVTAELYFGPAYAAGGYPRDYAVTLDEADWVWPGTPDESLVAARWRGEPGIDLETWFEQERRLTHSVIDAMLAGWRSQTTDLLMGYVPALDQTGHLLLLEDVRQNGYSEARRDERRRMRDRVWQLVDAELGRVLDAVDLRTTTVAVVSDHGMQPVHTAIDLDTVLESVGLLTFAGQDHIDPARTEAWAFGYGGVAHVYFNLIGREPGGIVPVAEAKALGARVRAALAAISLPVAGGTENPVAAIYSRAEAAALSLDSENSGDLIAFAVPGYVFRSDWRRGTPVSSPSTSYGDHGYFKDEPSMRAIFMALGSGVEKRSAGVTSVLAVAPRASAWLGIDAPAARPRVDHAP